MIIPLWLGVLLLVLGAGVVLSAAVLLCMLINSWWVSLMHARTLQRWKEWGGPDAYAYFHDRISYRAVKALTDAKREWPDDDRHQAMAVATAVHQYMSRTDRPRPTPEEVT